MPPGLGVFLDDNFLIQRVEIALKLRIAAGKRGIYHSEPGQGRDSWKRTVENKLGEPEEHLRALLPSDDHNSWGCGLIWIFSPWGSGRSWKFSGQQNTRFISLQLLPIF